MQQKTSFAKIRHKAALPAHFVACSESKSLTQLYTCECNFKGLRKHRLENWLELMLSVPEMLVLESIHTDNAKI